MRIFAIFNGLHIRYIYAIETKLGDTFTSAQFSII